MFPEHSDWITERLQSLLPEEFYVPSDKLNFRQEYFLLNKHIDHGQSAKIVEQIELPMSGKLAPEKLDKFAAEIIAQGAEGVMLRDPNKQYECCRSHNLLKYKPFDDMEGEVVGFITGRETDKGSKLLGLMGAMVLRLDSGVRLELSGFTDAERELEGFHHTSATRARCWAEANPESEVPIWIDCVQFKRGDRITFKYRGLTKDGVPQEARFWREDDRI
jgi:ATP-dependent DNA ligase